MTSIEIKWLISSRIEEASIALNDDVVQNAIDRFQPHREGWESKGCYHLTQGDRYWTMTFVVPTVADALVISGHAVATIRSLAFPMSCYGKADPMRRFVKSEGDDITTQNLNLVLVNLDGDLDNLRAELKMFKDKCATLVQGITVAAKDLKATRSQQISSLVGGKLKEIRLYLERLAK